MRQTAKGSLSAATSQVDWNNINAMRDAYIERQVIGCWLPDIAQR